MKRQLAFLFDAQHCSGCMACVVACQDQNDWKAEDAVFRRVTCYEKGTYPANPLFVSLSCMHCGDAPCLLACPTGALFRHEGSGIVDVDRDVCIGCHSCELACPFGAPQFAKDGKMAKCDLCRVRVENGLEPACVHTCTTGALQLGTVGDLAQEKSRSSSLRILRSLDLS
jgi:anaerobic dimethyl sulfoxide reductase subunit B